MLNEIAPSRLQEMSLYKDLRLRMLRFESRYFQDMTFKKKSVLNKIARTTYLENDGQEVTLTEDAWEAITLRRWLIVYPSKKYRLEKTACGICNGKKELIIVRKVKNKTEEDSAILHEMTHAYEFILPDFLRQFLLLHLYDQLVKKLGSKKLWRYIFSDNHVMFRVHSPLFLLKSLDLDLKRKLPLGTIYDYGRTDYFK